MPSYRLEVSPNARAFCKNKECKDSGVKIQKGELRFGTLVTIDEHTSWAYKHWGCVTPIQIANLQETTGGDTDLVDGYDELTPETQNKAKFALANGHVPDEDWKGDAEVNRPGQKGFRAKAPKAPRKKKGKKADDDDGDEDASADEKPKPKKRGRAAKDDEDVAPAPKKAKGRPKKAAVKEEEDIAGDDEDVAPAPKKARGRPKKATVKEEEEALEDKAEIEEPKPKQGRRKAAAKKEVKEDSSEDPEAEAEVEAPKAKRGRKTVAVVENEDKPVPQKRGRKKKVAEE
ncbi:hypothetical protein BDV95DRAFT_571610 [Massariosphaeria phaeospora]|uniref:PARP-type domain-containing protein n=1 Tax=Massariosphaeria phaeospora TaxID=100035 RepID=A0A7C8I6T5_9PLEO|nr:hypothetical protein BDV95DRAFT_571610 [Massariosphaeria phaeospora]